LFALGCFCDGGAAAKTETNCLLSFSMGFVYSLRRAKICSSFFLTDGKDCYIMRRMYEFTEIRGMSEAKKRRMMVAEYTAVQVFYWMGACCVTGYGAVFLKGRGFNNTALGLTIALGNIAGLLLSAILSSAVDRYKKINVFHCLFGLLSVEAVLELLLASTRGASMWVAMIIIVLMSCVISGQPMINQMCFYLDHTGKYINYGFSRSIGSLFYVPVTLTVGRLCSSISIEILPKLGIITICIQMVVFFVIQFLKNKYQNDGEAQGKTEEAGLSMAEFVKKNKRFFLFCLGTTVVFSSHYLSANFAINIIENLGGDAANVGMYSASMALCEVPFMLCYTRITRNIKCSSVIVFAVFMYILRSIVTALAPSLTMLYLTSVTQGLSYALITPALVDYASLVVDYRDSAKAQSLSISATTVGSILASCFGGVMLDAMSVQRTMLVAVAVCCVGVMITMAAIDRKTA